MKLLNGKVDLGLCFQFTVEVFRMVERMELETMALIVLALLITPFVMGSLWTLGIAIFWQLLWLGMKAGMFLFTICSIFMAYLRCRSRLSWKGVLKGTLIDLAGTGTIRRRGKATDEEEDPEEAAKPKCTILDAMLSVLFQTGLTVPAALWDFGMEVCLGKMERENQDEEPDLLSSILEKTNWEFKKPTTTVVKQEVALPNRFRLASLRSGSSNTLAPMSMSQDSSDTDGSGTHQDSGDDDMMITESSAPQSSLVGYLENVYVYSSPPNSTMTKTSNKGGGRRKRGPKRKKAVETLREVAAAEGIRLNVSPSSD